MKHLAIAAAAGMMLFAGQASAANYEEIAAQVGHGRFCRCWRTLAPPNFESLCRMRQHQQNQRPAC